MFPVEETVGHNLLTTIFSMTHENSSGKPRWKGVPESFTRGLLGKRE